MDSRCIYVGMDLGTFKTALASSTGTREVLPTAVGWPRDHVARKLLGKEVVFGKEIAEQRLALDVVRPLAKGVLKYLAATEAGMPAERVARHTAAARQLVAHAVSRLRLPHGTPVYGVIGAPARASVASKQFLLEAARETFAAVAIASEPFLVAYEMNCLSDCLVVDVGAGTVDLCPMYGACPSEEDQVTLPIGGDYVDEEFANRLREAYPEAQLSGNMAREIKEKYGSVQASSQAVVVTLPANGKPRPFDVTAPLHDACRVMGQAIVEGVQGLIARLDPEFQQRLLRNIVLCGGGSQLRGLDTLIEAGLEEYGGGKVTRVQDAVFAGAFGALRLAMSMPPEYWGELGGLEVESLAA
jgi:rod shape-determining protein MreB